MQSGNEFPQMPEMPGAPDGAAADPNQAWAQPAMPGAPIPPQAPGAVAAFDPHAMPGMPAAPAVPDAMQPVGGAPGAPMMPGAPAPDPNLPAVAPAAMAYQGAPAPSPAMPPAGDAPQFVPQHDPSAAPMPAYSPVDPNAQPAIPEAAQPPALPEAEQPGALADDPAMALPSLPDLPPVAAHAAPPAGIPTPPDLGVGAPPTGAPAGAPPSFPGAPPSFPGSEAPPSFPGGEAPPMPTMPTMPDTPPQGDGVPMAVAGLGTPETSLPMGSTTSGPNLSNLRGATAMQLQGKKLRIGEVLIDMGLIDQGQLDHALKIQKETGQRLGKVLIGEGLVSSTDIARALSRRLSIEFVDLLEMPLDDTVLSMIPFDTCTRYDVVPIGESAGSLLVAMADPTNVFALDDLRLVTGRDVRVVVASPEAIDIVVSRMISLDEAVDTAVGNADDWDEEHIALEDIKNTDAEAPAVNLVNQIITQAVVTGASDLHFEPRSDDMIVRFRKDGVLHHVTTVPVKLRAGVTSRLKIMASLDISERRKPQDGRVGLRVGDKPIDLRVASLPTVYGEKMVLRVLDKTNVMLDMSDLGFLPEQLEKLRYCYTQPYGCLLVTGPTGSGKSTTLYGAVNEINDIIRNIITVEDPVEYRLRGINQVQINNKAGLTFPAALRSILRSDPDVVMIGEMRDYETAHIGIEASLTGHLVLSTLHTNDAPGAVTRLTEMGIEPYLVSSSVLGVLAQRLARRLCKCAEEYTPEREYLVEMKYPQWVLDKYDAEPFQLRRPVGCERCGQKGYKGRLGLHEVMLMSEAIADLAIARASSEVIAKVAVEEGMITLWEDGVHKILRGHTTMEELQRIVQH